MFILKKPIFQDSNGLAVKFFIQKDIPQEIQAEVCETIAVCSFPISSQSCISLNFVVSRHLEVVLSPKYHVRDMCWCSPELRRRNVFVYAGPVPTVLNVTSYHTHTSKRARSTECS